MGTSRICSTPDSQQPQLVEPLSPLLPSSSLPVETDDNLYDIRVPPIIGSTVTPYFDLATEITHQVAPALLSFNCIQKPVISFRRAGATILNTMKSYSVPVSQLCVCQLTVWRVLRRLELRVYSTSVNWMKIAGGL